MESLTSAMKRLPGFKPRLNLSSGCDKSMTKSDGASKSRSGTSVTNSKTSIFDLFSRYKIGSTSDSSAAFNFPADTAPQRRAVVDADVQPENQQPSPKICRRSQPECAGGAGVAPHQTSATTVVETDQDDEEGRTPSSPKRSDDVTVIKTKDFKSLFTFLTELHRKEDKVIVYVARTRCDVGAIPKGTELALKVLVNRKFAIEQQFRSEFVTHMKCCALNHPNIVRCYPVRLEDRNKTHFAMATELSPMGNLTYMPRDKQMSEVVNIVRDIALALKHMHARGYIHCDVKRENIVRSAEGSQMLFKLMDFGSARRIGRHFDQSQGAGFTTSYAPPEIFAENEASAGTYLAHASIDVWELGITALRLCGVRPWKKAVPNCDDYRDFCEAVSSGKANVLPASLDNLPAKLLTVLPHILHPTPSKRCSVVKIIASLSHLPVHCRIVDGDEQSSQ
ncbi:serine/threonine-protein kinase SBK1-like [Sycon ciliatum]|uniref:serine/threonine-protein kinase SBK1-like n=1 Tax=Sycon ciliatum TaxID=27933 RepID=UPI0031F62BF2